MRKKPAHKPGCQCPICNPNTSKKTRFKHVRPGEKSKRYGISLPVSLAEKCLLVGPDRVREILSEALE